MHKSENVSTCAFTNYTKLEDGQNSKDEKSVRRPGNLGAAGSVLAW